MTVIYEKILAGKNKGERSILKIIQHKYQKYIILNYLNELDKKEKEIKVNNLNELETEIMDLLIKEDVLDEPSQYIKVAKNLIKEITKVVPSKSDSTSSTTNTTNTSDTSNTSSNLYDFGLVLTILRGEFSGTLKERILMYFMGNKNTSLTIANLAEKIESKKDSVRSTINYNKSLFVSTSSQGKKGLVQVEGSWIESIINEYNLKKQQELEKEEERKQELKITEEYENDIKTFIRNYKFKREGQFIYLDFNNLIEYDPSMADSFLSNPIKFIEIFSNNYDNKLEIQILNLPSSVVINIEEIREEHLNEIICVEGRVTSFGEVRSLITNIKFYCPSCGSSYLVTQNYRMGNIKFLQKCSCGRKGGFKIIDKIKQNASFLQLEDLQDKTDNPHSQRVKSIIFDGLCNKDKIKMFTPGNEVKCVGILKEVPVFKGAKETLLPDKIFEILSAELIEKDIDVNNFEEDEIKKINILSSKINKKGIDYILPSFAPDIFGYNEIKGAMILQLCNRRNDKRKKAVRNKSNILMIGDPGIAKSVLGDFSLSVSTGSRKAVGGGSSAVGITASVVKEEDSLGGYRVEPGAMVLAKDLLFIDELNNLSDEDKPKLQEGMNEQTISINKANIHVQMKVTSGIIAAANPVHGHFKEDSKLSMQEQFNIPSPILNRFDSIFVMKDYVDDNKDKLIAERMIQRQRGIIKPKYDKEFLKKFFAYIRHFEEPIIDNKIQVILQEVYAKARKTYNSGVKINPRFLESLIRMSISVAKLRQSKKVELKDIEASLDILSQTQYNVSGLIVNDFKIKK